MNDSSYIQLNVCYPDPEYGRKSLDGAIASEVSNEVIKAISILTETLDKNIDFTAQIYNFLNGKSFTLGRPESASGAYPGLDFTIRIILCGDIELGKIMRIDLIYNPTEEKQ